MKNYVDDKDKIKYLEKYADDLGALAKKSKETIEEFKQYVEEGLEKEWEVAMFIKGNSCYGGNDLYECDWVESEKWLSKFAEKSGNPNAYNSLGYIYYYGRCTGEPDYEKAFKCFVTGHACGIYESTYKLADMYHNGYGVKRNDIATSRLILQIYHENYEIFNRGNFDCDFADIALRTGGLFENGIGVDIDVEFAYAMYLQAKYAIEKRIKKYNFYGDGKVKSSIKESLERVRKKLPKDYHRKHIMLDTPGPMGDLLEKSMGLDIILDKVDDQYYLLAQSVGKNEEASGKTLVTVADLDYCKLTKKIGLYLVNPNFTYGIESAPCKYYITGITFDEDDELWQLWYREKLLLAFECDGFVFCGD